MRPRLKELEAAAEQLQAALLAELEGPVPAGRAATKKKSKAKKSKKKQVGSLQGGTITHELACALPEACLGRKTTKLGRRTCITW